MTDSPNQAWFHYSLWEDWQAGMYARLPQREGIVAESRALLAEPDRFALVLEEVIAVWEYAAAQNLSNIWRNHQPWCGRAASSFEFGATVSETNAAWASLTSSERLAANAVADRLTFRWRTKHMPGQMRMPV